MHDLGRAKFIALQLRLGITDAWRNWWPDKREFTGPGRNNRIEYVFLSPKLLSDYLVIGGSIGKTTYLLHLQSILQTIQPLHPFNGNALGGSYKTVCATCAGIQFRSMCERMRCDERSNCGGLFDEHKRSDSIFLRQMVREFKNHELENHRYLRQ
ncbi:hypothetical protein PsorP6_000241 [Peronosclerospora sorghi]|uniref:Uncharacterized protein n=1 Tax=Peronosclerospora sorghi TaxID=230839 RepID=A0ACC0WV72_9STRA|nr:hypothetical protein PsorP6_000241 [Peronosclerospora sorghi]